MATCPECEAELDIDEFDVEKGDDVSCHECGTSLRVTSLSPLEVEALDGDDDEDEDEENVLGVDDDGLEDEDDDDDEEEDWEE